MPLYEYQCKKCQRLTERIVKFSDPPLTVCPHCGGEMEQLISAPAVQFKGSGWYVTDYAKSGKAAKSDSTSSGSSGDPPATSSTDKKSPDAIKSDGSKPEAAKSTSSASKENK